MTDPELMAAIREKYGSFIDAAVAGTPFPASLVAALVANESGLNEAAARFEPAVFGELAFVLTGRKAAFGSIGAQDLGEWLGRVSMDKGNGGRLSPQAAVVLALQNLATSWGPTQIMGYQAVAGKYDLSELPNLQTHFHRAVAMLEDFRKRFNLAIEQGIAGGMAGNSAAAFFTCWNTGSPHGATFDPHYAANGLARMAEYEAQE